MRCEDITLNENKKVLGVYSDTNELVGGASVEYCLEYNNVKTVKIGHVWILPKCQGQGIGKFLMKEIEHIAVHDGRELMQLNVANIYKPAIELYKRSNFKDVKIYANFPKTYYFVRMIKSIGNYKFSECRRRYMLIKSYIIFGVLYHRDSSPTIINKVLYGR